MPEIAGSVRRIYSITEEIKIEDILKKLCAIGMIEWNDSIEGPIGDYLVSGTLKNGKVYHIFSNNRERTLEVLTKSIDLV